MTTKKAATVHISGDWGNDGIEQFTACGQASNTPKYTCTSDIAKVTCKRCLHNQNAVTAISAKE